MLLARLAAAPTADREPGAMLSARDALDLATRGGAAVLGREDVGSLEPGKAADFFAVGLDRVEYAGALHDPVAAVLFCAPVTADLTYVHGRPVVEDGRPVSIEMEPLVREHNVAARRLVSGD